MTNEEVKQLDEGTILWDGVNGVEVTFVAYQEPVEFDTDHESIHQSGDFVLTVHNPDHPDDMQYQLAAALLSTELPEEDDAE